MKLGLTGLVAASVFALAACGSNSHADKVVAAVTTTTTSAPLSTDATSPTPTTLAAAETATTAATHARAATSTTAAHAGGGQVVPTTTTAPSGTVVSSTHNPSYGEILVDSRGRTLYLFTPDNGMSSPQCTGSCAQTWPPLKASGTPRATGGAQQSMLGVESGQVTYNGHPLYLYAGDSAAGQTNGEGVAGIWYVINTAGNPVLH